MTRWILIASVLVACGGAESAAPPGAGASPDAGAIAAVNGCTADKFVDSTAAGASRTVAFSFFKYTPACLTVAAGQSVTFSGDFFSHPLRAGVAPSAGSTAGSAQNPITSVNGGNSATFLSAQPGVYPYFCAAHENIGMYGAIQVR